LEDVAYDSTKLFQVSKEDRHHIPYPRL
jgi:hypothetical protein